jgi:hypothetical protein
MPSPTDFPARGKIIEVRDAIVIFQPSNTNYQLHLEFADDAKPQVSAQPIECFIRVEARKVYTVPSGGNFIQPIRPAQDHPGPRQIRRPAHDRRAWRHAHHLRPAGRR